MALEHGRILRIPVRGLSAALLVCGISLSAIPAHAVNKGNIGKMMTSQNGRSTSLSYPTPTNSGGSSIPVSPNYGGWSQAGNYGVPPGATGPTAGHLTSSGEFVVGGSGVKYPVQSKAPIPWGALAPVAAGVVCVVTTAGWCAVAAGVAAGAPGIMDWLNQSGIQRDPDTGELSRRDDASTVPKSDGFVYALSNVPGVYQTISHACDAVPAILAAKADYPGFETRGVVTVIDRGAGFYWCRVERRASNGSWGFVDQGAYRQGSSSCPAGWYVLANSPNSCYSTPPGIKLTPQQVGEALAGTAPADGRPWGETLERGGEVPMPKPEVTGPSTVPGKEVVTERGDGTKSVSTTTYHFTTNNNTVTNTHNTTVTNNYNSSNQLTGTETKTEKPAEAEVPTKPEEQPGLCDLYPDILACAKVPEADVPDGEIPREDRDVDFQQEDLLGSGSCPANVMTSLASLGGRSVTLVDWAQLCTWSLPLRALVLALASLTALFILMPGGVRE